MKIKLTIKVIIRWEQMCGKSFSSIDYTSQADTGALLYASVICNNPEASYTLEEFNTLYQNEKLIRQLAVQLEKEARIIAQFQQSAAPTSGNKESEQTGYIKDIVSTIILSGLSPDYAMNEMELCDLPMFIEAYERQKREQMESSRLWTFINILPHIDSKKITSPKEIYIFPWEESESKKTADLAIQDDADMFERFLEEGKNIFK